MSISLPIERSAVTQNPNEYRQVLTTVYRWSPAERIALIQDLLNTLAPAVQRTTPTIKTLDLALGLLADDRPAPSDEEVAKWLEEHRQKKFD
jgi:hypothetical protein